MKRYENYKKVNLPWLEEIPEHWDIRKLKDIGFFSASGIDKKIIETEIPIKIVNYTDVYGNKSYELKNKNYMIVTTSKEKKKRHDIKKGDMIFTPSSETIDDIGISAVAMEDLESTSYSYHVLRFRFNENIDLRFKKYFCNNNIVLNYFSSEAKGTTRQILNRYKFKMADVILPSKSEQEKIAAFLDYKISRIDKAIELEEKKKEELQNYIESFIEEKLNQFDNVDKIKVKYIGTFSKGGGFSRENLTKSKIYPAILYGDIYTQYNFITNKTTHYIDKEAFNQSNKITKDTLLITGTGETKKDIGKCIVYTGQQKIAIGGDVIIFKPDKNKIYPKYLMYQLNSYKSKKYKYENSNGDIIVHISAKKIGNIDIDCIDYQKQISISSTIESKINKYDDYIVLVNKKIEKLKSLKQSLISEVVTGQIDVRDFEIPKVV